MGFVVVILAIWAAVCIYLHRDELKGELQKFRKER